MGGVIVPTFECPTCRKVFGVDEIADAPFRPFCGKRCKLVDLGRWLDGTYCISKPIHSEDIETSKLDDHLADEGVE